MTWKKVRGKLGPLESPVGSWSAEGDSRGGRGARTFTSVLDGRYMEPRVRWAFPGYSYEELATIFRRRAHRD
jgi:hypothetical protein